MAHGGEAEFRKSDTLRLNIPGMIFDLLDRFAASVAVPQFGRVFVSGKRPFVQLVRCTCAQQLPLRQQIVIQAGAQMPAQQRTKGRIARKKILCHGYRGCWNCLASSFSPIFPCFRQHVALRQQKGTVAV